MSDYSLGDIVSCGFTAAQFIPYVDKMGPIAEIKMTFQTYLKYKAAGYKIELLLNGNVLEITPPNSNIPEVLLV